MAPPHGSKPTSRARRQALALALLVASALTAVAVGCGEDGGDETAAADVERYCELTAELDRAGTKALAKLERDPEATDEDFERAERELVQSHEAEIEEVQDVAPSEIAESVRMQVRAIRARAGLSEPVDEAEARVAERRVQQFEKQNC